MFVEGRPGRPPGFIGPPLPPGFHFRHGIACSRFHGKFVRKTLSFFDGELEAPTLVQFGKNGIRTAVTPTRERSPLAAASAATARRFGVKASVVRHWVRCRAGGFLPSHGTVGLQWHRSIPPSTSSSSPSSPSSSSSSSVFLLPPSPRGLGDGPLPREPPCSTLSTSAAASTGVSPGLGVFLPRSSSLFLRPAPAPLLCWCHLGRTRIR